MTAAQPQSDLDRPSRPLPPLVLARLRAERMYEDPVERERFMDLFRTLRALTRPQRDRDSYTLFRKAVLTGDSVLIAALVEAEASLRTGPLVP